MPVLPKHLVQELNIANVDDRNAERSIFEIEYVKCILMDMFSNMILIQFQKYHSI